MAFNNNDDKKFFLATTALEEFWDLSANKIIFLGDWCCRYDREEIWSQLNYEILPRVAYSYVDRTSARLYINNLEERLKKILAIELNKLHNETRTQHYWTLLLETWVHTFLSRMYDIYLSLKVVQEKELDIYTFGLAPENYMKTRVATDEDYFLARDDYNIQLYTEMMKAMGFKIEYKRYTNPIKVEPQNIKSNIMLMGKSLFENLVFELSCLLSKKSLIITKNTYLTLFDEIKLYLKSKGKIGFIKKREAIIINRLKDDEIRGKLRFELNNSNEFEVIISKLVKRYLPEIFVEQYKDLVSKNKKYCKAAPRIIVAGTPWLFHNNFNFWAAGLLEKGTQLYGMQHGGNYGIEAYIEEPELNMMNKFITWGWVDKENDKIIKGIATKLNSRKKRKSENQKSDILFVTTAPLRYRTTFRDALSSMIKEYQEDQLQFISTINKEILQNILVRPNYYDAGIDTYKIITNFDKNIRFQTWDIKFQNAVKDSKICVFDHLATTFLEALFVNKPTILFWRDLYLELKPEAVKYLENFKAVGILHNNPQSAANVLNEIYEDIETWWNNNERQKVVKEFCDNFAYAPQNALDLFMGILLK